MAGVAARYGEVGAAPYLIPLSVDGLVVVASVCLVELSGRIQTAAEQAVTTADIPADIQPDTPPEDTARPEPATRRTGRKRDTGKAVARLRARHPDLPAAEIAKRLGVTDRTVRRHLTSATT